MKRSFYSVALDLHLSETPRALFVKKGDTVREIRVTFVENGEEYELTPDCRAVLCAILADGNEARMNMEKTGNRLYARIPGEWTKTAGRITCEVQVIGSTPAVRLTSPMFSVIVVETLSSAAEDIFAYWCKGSFPTASASRSIPIADANFEFDFPEEANAYNGWVLIPKSLYPDGGVYICSTGGIVFPYDSEQPISVGGGKYVTFKCFKSPNTFSAHQYVIVREREES
ncbi:MAG: hypothetical protein IKI03_05490 [Clostridia bacterium]|nr:hypothetical protein [Clostridia bacterium]